MAEVVPVFEDADPADVDSVAALIGRRPKAAFTVVVRADDGTPVVTRNAPLERDGTPMPTRYWLLPSSQANDAIGRLEAAGGVRAAERAVDPDALRCAHERYAAERDAAIPRGWAGPRPVGGVGGTRQGTKCLHAHYAHFLAGDDDPVGRWVWEHLAPSERDRRVSAAAGVGHPEGREQHQDHAEHQEHEERT